jgi:DNA-directed RNA polymerase subunit omega
MARITVEDCLEKVSSRFGLIHLAAKRVRQLRKGAEPLVVCKNKDIVVSLREIANGKVFPMDKEDADYLTESIEEHATEQLPEQTPEQADAESPEQEQGDQKEIPEAG